MLNFPPAQIIHLLFSSVSFKRSPTLRVLSSILVIFSTPPPPPHPPAPFSGNVSIDSLSGRRGGQGSRRVLGDKNRHAADQNSPVRGLVHVRIESPHLLSRGVHKHTILITGGEATFLTWPSIMAARLTAVHHSGRVASNMFTFSHDAQLSHSRTQFRNAGGGGLRCVYVCWGGGFSDGIVEREIDGLQMYIFHRNLTCNVTQVTLYRLPQVVFIVS